MRHSDRYVVWALIASAWLKLVGGIPAAAEERARSIHYVAMGSMYVFATEEAADGSRENGGPDVEPMGHVEIDTLADRITLQIADLDPNALAWVSVSAPGMRPQHLCVPNGQATVVTDLPGRSPVRVSIWERVPWSTCGWYGATAGTLTVTY